MIQLKKSIFYFLVLTLVGCTSQKNVLQKTLASKNPNIKRVMDNAK